MRLAAAGIRVAAGTPFQAGQAGQGGLTAPGGHFVRVTAGLVRDDFDSVAASLASAAWS